MQVRKILITGGTGLLGKALIANSPKNSITAITHMNEIDIELPPTISTYKMSLEDSGSLVNIIKDFQPDVIFHTAALGSVDEAEKNKEYAKKINFDILDPLVKTINEQGSTLVFISSNAVYDGENPPYDESSIQKAVNYYGELKSLAENFVRENSQKFIIIRPILMYGWPEKGRRDNPFSWIVKTLRGNKSLKLVNDTITMPLLDRDCAIVCWKSLDFIGQEFNIAGSEKITFFDFGKIIADEFGFDLNLISPVSSDAFPTIARRPRDTSFDISKVQSILDFHPMDVRSGIRYLKETQPI